MRLRPVYAALAGALVVGAFAPFNLWWLTLPGLMGLLALWQDQTPRQAFVIGWGYGLGLFGAGIHWVFISIHQFGHAPLSLAVTLTLALIAFMAIFPALVGYALNRWFPVSGLGRYLLAFPALWLVNEWARTWIFTGFPWLLLGYTPLQTPLAGYAPVLGVLGVGWLVTLTAGALWHLIAARSAKSLVGAGVIAVLWTAGISLQTLQWTQPEGSAASVALVQGNVSQDQKWLAENRLPMLRRYLDLTRPHWGKDLVIWPEVAVTLPYHLVATGFIDNLQQEARAAGSDVLLGILRLDFERGQYFNSVLALDDQQQFYNKHHLVPFGEYFPVPEFIRKQMKVLDLPYTDMGSAALATEPLTVGKWRVAVSICYEAVFGREVMSAVPRAQFLVNVSNDAWFGNSIAPHQHLQMAQMRALEAGREMLRATNTGVTAIIDHRGEIVSRLPQFESAVLTGQVQPRSGVTPYVRWTDWPAGAMAGLFGLLALATKPRQPAKLD